MGRAHFFTAPLSYRPPSPYVILGAAKDPALAFCMKNEILRCAQDDKKGSEHGLRIPR